MIIEFTVLILYILGYIITLRYTIGAFLSMQTYGKPDGADLCFGILFGMFMNIAWPALVFFRITYVWWVRRGESLSWHNVFPAPKPVESKQESLERRLRESEEKYAKRMREINHKERELGMEPTVWLAGLISY